MKHGWRAAKIAAGVAAVLMVGSGYAWAQSTSAQIYACVAQGGALRVVGGPGECIRDRVIWWNKVGPQGPQGVQGPDGLRGATGARGVTGAQGPAGATGPIGLSVAGPRGLQGARGPQGEQGQVGPQGLQGPRGIPGLQGAKGDRGPSAEGTLFGTNTNGAKAGRSDGAECTIGQILLTSAPIGPGMPANGQLLPISQNQALYSLLGNRFGGTAPTTFALPDLRKVAPNGMTYSICVWGIYPSAL